MSTVFSFSSWLYIHFGGLNRFVGALQIFLSPAFPEKQAYTFMQKFRFYLTLYIHIHRPLSWCPCRRSSPLTKKEAQARQILRCHFGRRRALHTHKNHSQEQRGKIWFSEQKSAQKNITGGPANAGKSRKLLGDGKIGSDFQGTENALPIPSFCSRVFVCVLFGFIHSAPTILSSFTLIT